MRLAARLNALPKRTLAWEKTPLHPLAGLQKHLGGPQLWIKRDDLSGFGFGGNKVRKLELLLADALARRATCLVTAGAAQSNHARVTAVAARSASLGAYLVLAGQPTERLSGNLLLDDLAQAETIFVDTTDWNKLRSRMDEVLEDLASQGERPYPIPVGGSNAIGSAAFAHAALEMLEQLPAPPTRVVVSSGSGGTQAGLEVGLRAASVDTVVSGIMVAKVSLDLADRVASLASETAALLGFGHRWDPPDIDVCTSYFGAAYGKPTEEGEAAIRLLVETDGIFLDHVYTGKAMAGLIGEVRRGAYGASERIVFWHTGGTPQLFAAQA